MKKIILLLLLSVSAIAQRQIEQKRIENLADSLAKKVNGISGKGLSTNDYLSIDKNSVIELQNRLLDRLEIGTGKTNIYFGNSITVGVTLPSPTTQRWSTLLTGYMGATESNMGISGTTMQKVSNGDNSMEDRVSAIPAFSKSIHNLLFFSYGVNDSRGTGFGDTVTYKTTLFKAAYRVVLNAAIAKGWNPQRIVLLTPSKWNDKAWTYRNYQYKTAVQEIASEYGTKYYDFLGLFDRNGGTSLLNDNIHPTVAANKMMADSLFAALGSVNFASSNFVVNQKSQFNDEINVGSANLGTSSLAKIKLGGTYSTDSTSKEILKLELFRTGTETSGMAVTLRGIEYRAMHGQKRHIFQDGNVEVSTGNLIVSNNGLIRYGNYSAASSTQTILSLGARFSGTGGRYAKLALFDEGTENSQYGLGVSIGQLDYIAPATRNHAFYVGGNRVANINSNGFVVGSSTINQSAALDIPSTTKGVLLPRMTTAQKNAIASPATGLLVFDTDLNKLCIFLGTWRNLALE